MKRRTMLLQVGAAVTGLALATAGTAAAMRDMESPFGWMCPDVH